MASPAPSQHFNAFFRYAAACLFTIVALAITNAFHVYAQHAPFLILFTAIVLSSAYGGVGPGLLSTVISTCSYNYFFVSPTYHLGLSLADLWRTTLFVACALLVSAVHEARQQAENKLILNELALRRSQEDLATLNAELERKVKERTDELRKKEEELYQSRKLEAMGRLAGGVAHDFNNLLTGILGMTEELQHMIAPESAAQSELSEIAQACQRAFGLTRQLLTFGRRQAIQPRVIELNGVIRDLGQLVRRLIREDIQLELDLQDVHRIKADPTQISQVVMNLALNARDAMPGSGVLTVRTVNIPKEHPLNANGYCSTVMMEVSDTGIGMSGDVLEHLFEPFFTTKDHARGTGLGLATVYGIVQQSGGRITVNSKPGVGTTFRIFFPAVSEEVESAPAVPPPPPTTNASGGAILVIDDELLVRRVMGKKLRREGFQVVEAKSGEEALELARSGHPQFDLVITDVVMPGLNGREFMQSFKEFYPNVPVLYMSGYSREVVGRHGVLDQSNEFIDKAGALTDLIERVRSILSQRPVKSRA